MWLNDRLPDVGCRPDGGHLQAQRPEFRSRAASGRNLLVDVQSGDVVELNFPVPAQTDKYTIDGKAYKIQFRGGTVVDIDNRNTSAGMIPIYQREAMKATKAPMHTVKRFVTDKLLPLSVE